MRTNTMQNRRKYAGDNTLKVVSIKTQKKGMLLGPAQWQHSNYRENQRKNFVTRVNSPYNSFTAEEEQSFN